MDANDRPQFWPHPLASVEPDSLLFLEQHAMPICTIEGSVLLITPAASANQNITLSILCMAHKLKHSNIIANDWWI